MAQKLGEGTAVDASDPSILGRIFGTVFSLATVVAGIFVFYQLILGSINWINSQGDKDKIAKSQKQITNALIGLVLLMSVWTIYFTITTDILGIFGGDAKSPVIKIPSLFGP